MQHCASWQILLAEDDFAGQINGRLLTSFLTRRALMANSVQHAPNRDYCRILGASVGQTVLVTRHARVPFVLTYVDHMQMHTCVRRFGFVCSRVFVFVCRRRSSNGRIVYGIARVRKAGMLIVIRGYRLRR